MSDSIVGPVVDGLIAIANTIPGIGRSYREPPEGPPEDNSVLYPLKSFAITDATNGLLVYTLTFEVMHLFRRGRLQDTIADVHTFLPLWLDRLTAWPNQTLGGTAISLNLTGGKVATVEWGGQKALALILGVEVLTQQPISMA